MLFRRLILNALFVGLIAGLLLSMVQFVAVNPIIFAAETFEVAEEPAPHHHEGAGESHSHDADAWAPEDGIERTLFTLLSNVLAGVGFAAILLAVMSQMQSKGLTQLKLKNGLAWGLAGFCAFFLAPGLGLPPEIPGMQAAVIEHRQLWWLLAVAGVGLGLMVLVFAPLKWKALGMVAVVLPYLMPVPHHDGPAFAHPDPQAVEALTALHQQFVLASGSANLVFWLALGVCAAWALNRFVVKGQV